MYAEDRPWKRIIVLFSFFSYKPTERKYHRMYLYDGVTGFNKTTPTRITNTGGQRIFFLNVKIALYELFYTKSPHSHIITINFYEIILDRPNVVYVFDFLPLI